MTKILVTTVSEKQISGVIQSGEAEVGREYFLEDARDGTMAQNKLFHLLIRIYYDSQAYSYPATTLDDLKKYVLRSLGAGFSWVAYVKNDGTIGKTTEKKLPAYVRPDQVLGNPKSWSVYNLKERRNAISNLITQMIKEGVHSPTFESICKEFHDMTTSSPVS